MNEKTTSFPKLYNMKEAAKKTGFSDLTIKKAVQEGLLKTVNPTGRRAHVREEDLLIWMQRGGEND